MTAPLTNSEDAAHPHGRDIMLDLETLDILPTAAVASVAWARFDMDNPAQDPMVTTALLDDISRQVRHGRTMCPDTVQWWLRQPKHAQEASFPADYAMATTMGERLITISSTLHGVLGKLMREIRPEDRLWSRSTMDWLIMQHVWNSLPGDRFPYRQMRDQRTLVESAFGGIPWDRRPPNKHANLPAHIPAFDVLRQITDLRNAWYALHT